MSDPIERLDQFRSDIAGGPMLPSDAVRRRGDRIRRRKQAVMAGASIAVVAAITAPVLALTGSGAGSGKDEIQPAPKPGVGLNESNLMTDVDTVFDDTSDWKVAPKTATEGQGPVCQKRTYSDLGATTDFSRDWGLSAIANSDATDNTHFLHQDIAEFTTSDAAAEAYAEVVDWITECEPDAPAGYTSEEPAVGPLPIDGEGTYVASTYQRDGAEGGESYSDVLTNTAIVVSGDRLSVIQHTMPDSDYNWPNGGTETPVRMMMMTASERLVGEGLEVESTESSESESGGATRIPDDYPLDERLPPVEDATEFTPPTRKGLEPLLVGGECGGKVAEGPSFVDQMSTLYAAPEDVRARELTVYDAVGGAEAIMTSMVDTIEECPLGDERGDGYRSKNSVVEVPDVGDEAWAILQTDTLDGSPTPYGQTTLIVRVGQAVLHVVHSGEAGTPQGDGSANIDAMLVDLEANIDLMCQFSPDGC